MGSYSAEEYYYKLDYMILSSCQVLRQLFQTRWKKETGKSWEGTEDQGRRFIDGKGKAIYSKALKPQKTLIVKGCLEEWDMSTLSLVLLNFGNLQYYNTENEAVRRLTRIRNDLAHHSTKKLQKDEYNGKVDLFRVGLRALQVNDEVIEKIVEKAGLTSSVAAPEATKKLFESGEEYMKTEEFEKAIAIFDEATTMPSLLPVHQGVTYEKRADCYLKLAQQKKHRQMRTEADKCCEQALLDATEALELNDNSWKAHHLLAQSYRWKNNFAKALHHYQTALAISPVQQQVKNELDSCKALTGWRNLPVSLTEALGYVEEEIGCRLTEKQFIKLKRDVEGKAFKGQEDVFRGHQHANGWSVPQNDEEAARYYAKAAKVKNAEGIFNLGLCYRHGKGVKQDLKKAYQLYLEAAQMPAEIQLPGLTNYAPKNVGVVSAQHCVGVFYEYGIVVEQDYCEAVMWYKKATENGNGTSAYNLGLMYAQGRGVPKNLKTAEFNWNQGVIFEEPKAAETLMHYYLHSLEPERARAMFATGRKLESVALNGISEEEFNVMVQPIISHRQKYEDDLIAYERKNKLDTKGMTFLERLQRYSFTKDPNIAKFLKDLQDMDSIKSWGGKMNTWKDSEFTQLLRLAHEGSQMADLVVKATRANTKLSNFLNKMKMNDFSEGTTNAVLDLLYDFLPLQLDTGVTVNLPAQDGKTKLKNVVAHLLKQKCDGSTCEDDMKARYCYVYVSKMFAEKSTDAKMMTILQEGIKKYPDNVHYYNLLVNLYGLIGNHKSGLIFAEEGLKKFPDNPDLLYAKAGHLPMLSKNADCKQIIATYKLFLSTAPPDHRQVPEAYYTIASIYGLGQGSGKSAAISISKMEHYFNLGKESEANMLPCYLPYESGNKLGVESLLRIAQAAKPPSTSLPFSTESSEMKSAQPKHILEKKQYLCSPVRKRLILEHRSNLFYIAKQKRVNMLSYGMSMTKPPKLIQAAPKQMSRMKPITLQEMNPTTDAIYNDRMIHFRIVEDPYCFDFSPSCVHLLAEDDNGNLSRLYLHNFENHQKNMQERVSFGSTITILNPYMRIAVDGTNGIRNYEPKCVIYLEKIEKMCRFCGKENAPHKCSKCKRAGYCSKECQQLDWKMMKHKLICGI